MIHNLLNTELFHLCLCLKTPNVMYNVKYDLDLAKLSSFFFCRTYGSIVESDQTYMYDVKTRDF